MAAIDFPDSPTVGQVFDKWTWNGTLWVLTSSGGGGGSGFTFAQDAVPTATAEKQTWYNTATGDSFIWTNDGNSTQWVQFAPGSGGGGGSGFTYVQETAPTPSRVGDTWFDLSTAATGGTSWVAVEEAPGGEKVWVQFAPGSGAGVPAALTEFCWVQMTSAQNVGGGTHVVVWDLEKHDPLAMHTVPGTGIFVSSTGLWLFQTNITYASSAVGMRQLWFRVNGDNGGVYGMVTKNGVVDGADTALATTVTLPLSQNTYVEVLTSHTSGVPGGLAIRGSDSAQGYSAFTATKVGAV